MGGTRPWRLNEGSPSSPGHVRVDAASADVVRISIEGELDSVASPGIARALLGAIAQSPDVVVLHLGAVTFIDSSGLGVLNAVRVEALHHRVRFTLEAVPPAVRRALELTNMLELFEEAR